VNATDIVSIFLRGAVGGRGRKRATRAAKFLTGNKGFLTASTLLGAAGVAWGIYDSLKGTSAAGPAPAGGPGAWGSPSPATGPSAATAGVPGAVIPPPIPGVTEGGVPLADDVLRVIRLAVSAARADGTLTPEEREMILKQAREAGLEAIVEQEMNAPRPLAEIVRGVDDTQKRQDLYVLAFTIVRADENITGAERIYLAQLAHQLSLDAATVARLENETASRIDSTPE
jgi:uncharacterized membrane protein YebE (DUF533 family)